MSSNRGGFRQISPAAETNMIVRTIGNNYMTWGLGLALLIGCIVALLFIWANFGMIIAILLQVDDNGDHIHDLKGHDSSDCADGNDCTQDLYVNGHCENHALKLGTPCETACYDPEVDEEATHTCYIPPDCKDCPVCTGSVCSGVCETSGDCPVLETNNIVLGNTTANCQNDACIYNVSVVGAYTSITVPCEPDSPLFIDACTALLETSNALVIDRCMTSLPICGVNDTLDACAYYHNCAPPLAEIII